MFRFMTNSGLPIEDFDRWGEEVWNHWNANLLVCSALQEN
jgi:hypothetical protein